MYSKFIKPCVIVAFIYTPTVFAAHIDATTLYGLHSIAEVTSFTGTWQDTNGTTNDFADVSDLIFDPATGNDSVVFRSFTFSNNDNATLSFGFGADNIGNLRGNDLAIFTLGAATLDITIADLTITYSSSTINIAGVDQGVFSQAGVFLETNDVILIDLDDFMFLAGDSMNSFTINTLTMLEHPVLYPAITAVGSFNTVTISAVPLPLPLFLFVSGAGLLGLFARNKP